MRFLNRWGPDRFFGIQLFFGPQRHAVLADPKREWSKTRGLCDLIIERSKECAEKWHRFVPESASFVAENDRNLPKVARFWAILIPSWRGFASLSLRTPSTLWPSVFALRRGTVFFYPSSRIVGCNLAHERSLCSLQLAHANFPPIERNTIARQCRVVGLVDVAAVIHVRWHSSSMSPFAPTMVA